MDLVLNAQKMVQNHCKQITIAYTTLITVTGISCALHDEQNLRMAIARAIPIASRFTFAYILTIMVKL
jgi:hypothetical protein